MLLDYNKERDPDYLTAMKHSHSEAIRELQKINDNLKLIKEQTVNRRKTLDKDLAEITLHKRLDLDRVLFNLLTIIQNQLTDAIKLQKELEDLEADIKYCDKLEANKDDLPAEQVDSDDAEDNDDNDVGRSDSSDSTVIEVPCNLNDKQQPSEFIPSLETLLQTAQKHLTVLKSDNEAQRVNQTSKTKAIKGLRVKVKKQPGETDGNYRLKLLNRCQTIMRPYGIPMYDFSVSWSSGHALCALIHYHEPDMIDESYFSCKNSVVTLEYVSDVTKSLGIEFQGSLVKFFQQKRPSYVKVFNFVNSLYCNLVSYD